MFPRLICSLFFFIIAGPSMGATITVSHSKDGQVTFVAVEGDIAYGDEQEFQQKVSTISNAIVGFQSDGGNVFAAIQIGRLIRLRNFTTLVPDNMACASACALAWLGGTRRFMGSNARIGFHAAYNRDTGQETGAGNALMGAYLSQIGLPDVAVYYITQAAPTSMTWLNPSEARKVGIDVSMLNDERKAQPRPQGQVPPGFVPVPKSDSYDPRGRISPMPDAKEVGPNKPTMPEQLDTASQLHQHAKEFVRALYQTMSGPEQEIAPILNRVYSNTVQYFGKTLSRQDVITQEERFLARWPIRQYVPKNDTVVINCDENSLTCGVSGVIQFDARSTTRNQHSSGEATFEYLLQFSSARDKLPIIIAENGKVLRRDVRALSDAPDEPADSDIELFKNR